MAQQNAQRSDRPAEKLDVDALLLRVAELEVQVAMLVRQNPSRTGDWQPDWVSLKEACALLKTSGVEPHPATAKRKGLKEGFGHLRGGRWEFDAARIRAWRNDRPFPPLGGDVEIR